MLIVFAVGRRGERSMTKLDSSATCPNSGRFGGNRESIPVLDCCIGRAAGNEIVEVRADMLISASSSESSTHAFSSGSIIGSGFTAAGLGVGVSSLSVLPAVRLSSDLK